MSELVPLRVVAPGFYGLNTQLNTAPGLQWAAEATNCVIDAKGRLAARKGRQNVTTAAISGSPAVRAVFEQIRSDGTTTIISAAGNKLYSGTSTLTDITSTADDVTGITADHWQFQNIADKCVGFQAGHDPVVRTTGNFNLLQQDVTVWASTTAYVAGDVRRATAGNQTIYFHCTSSGTSGGAEPSWNTTVGGTTSDGTVTWTTRKMPNGNVCHSAFGRIWVTSNGDDSIVEFSDTLLPHKFRGGAAGTLDLKQVWGADRVQAIASSEDYLVFLGKRHILIYAGPETPSTMTLAEKIEGVGCIARDSVAFTGNDLVFLSASGVRLLSRSVEAGGRQPLGDMSVNVRDALMDEVAAETAANLKGVYHEAAGFYVLFLTADEIAWCFDFRFPNPDGSQKVTKWMNYGARAAFSASDRELYVGGDGRVCKYSGYTDGAAGTYALVYRSLWMDFTEADPTGRRGVGARFKIPKSWRMRAITNSAYSVTYTWAFDYTELSFASVDALVRESGVSEWNVAEWNEGEWSGGDVFADSRIHPDSHGQVMKIGMNVTINGAPIAFQEVLLAAKLGRASF